MMDSDFNEDYDVHSNIVGIRKQAGGSILTLACKHEVPGFPYQSYRFGDKLLCHRCSAKNMAVHLAKKLADDRQ